jgi:poly-gamma-glutamate synthesis protein (capsule biosynthesis protein)
MKIAFSGDIMPGAEVGEHVGQASLVDWLSGVSPAWKGADAVIGNLESPCVVEAKGVMKSQPELMFRAPAFRARELANAGFTVLTLANNHVLDCGPDGLRETQQALEAAGIRHAGAGMNLSAAMRPAIVRLGDKILGVVAFTYGPPATSNGAGAAPFERHVMARALAKARSSCDVLVAVLHAGLEYSDVPSRVIRERFHLLADNGADIVIGHHPHVLQGIEWKDEVPIAYSLGDLLFHNSLAEVTARNFGRMALALRQPDEVRRDPQKFARGAILTVEVSEGGKLVEWHPFRQGADLRPRLCTGEQRSEDLRRLEALSTALLDPQDPRHQMADRITEACREESLAALQWRELVLLGRRPKWRYIPRGIGWLASRLKKGMLGT